MGVLLLMSVIALASLADLAGPIDVIAVVLIAFAFLALVQRWSVLRRLYRLGRCFFRQQG